VLDAVKHKSVDLHASALPALLTSTRVCFQARKGHSYQTKINKNWFKTRQVTSKNRIPQSTVKFA